MFPTRVLEDADKISRVSVMKLYLSNNVLI